MGRLAEEGHVQLDDDQLESLDRRLSIQLSKLTPAERLTVRGPGGETEVAVPEAAGLREVKDEILDFYRTGVRIAKYAESRPLLPLYALAQRELPPEMKVDHERLRYNYYWVEVSFHVLLAPDQFPLSARLELELTDDVADAARRTRPVRLFPQRKDIRYFKADVEAGVGLDAGLNFDVPLDGLEAVPFARLKADAQVKAGFLIGPIEFQLRQAAVEVVGEADQHIVWRYNLASELAGTNQFKSILVLKVAQEAGRLAADAALEVVPCKRRWLIFRDALPPVGDKTNLLIELDPH